MNEKIGGEGCEQEKRILKYFVAFLGSSRKGEAEAKQCAQMDDMSLLVSLEWKRYEATLGLGHCWMTSRTSVMEYIDMFCRLWFEELEMEMYASSTTLEYLLQKQDRKPY